MSNQNGQYITAKGNMIDMNKLINKNELTVAVGNMKVNARGDKLGSGGQIVKTPHENMKKTLPEEIQEPEVSIDDTVSETPKPKKSTKSSDQE